MQRRGRATEGPDAPDVGGGKEPWGPARLALVAMPLFAGLAAGTTWWSVARVEQQLAIEVRADLAEAGIDPAGLTIDFEYRDGLIAGTLPSGVDPGAVAEAVDHRLLGRLDLASLEAAAAPTATPRASVAPDDRAQQRPEPERGPVEVVASYDGIGLTVAGTVLTEGQHNVVLETLDLSTGRAEIEGGLAISRLAPRVDGADARIVDLLAAIEAVERADAWSLHLTDRTLVVEATVTDAETAAAVGALDRRLTTVTTTIRLDVEPIEEDGR